MISTIGKIVGALSGNLGSNILKGVKHFFPASMTAVEKGALELKIMEVSQTQEILLLKYAQDAQSEFNDRIKAMEGTAAEIKSIPLVGPAIIALRSVLRPLISIFVIVLDYQIFSGAWSWNTELKPVFVALNVLVLGFWFGERMVKNVMPLFVKFMESKR